MRKRDSVNTIDITGRIRGSFGFLHAVAFKDKTLWVMHLHAHLVKRLNRNSAFNASYGEPSFVRENRKSAKLVCKTRLVLSNNFG
jgi:hypothetical protein